MLSLSQQSTHGKQSQAAVIVLCAFLHGSMQVVVAQPIVIREEWNGESIEIVDEPINALPRAEEDLPIISQDGQLASQSFTALTAFDNALEAASQTAQIDPNPTISSQSATSTDLNIWVTTGPLALSVAGVVIMGINVLTLVALVVVGTFLYKHKRHNKQPTRLSLDTINLNSLRPRSSHDYNIYESKDRSYLPAIHEHANGLGIYEQPSSPLPGTPLSAKFSLRGGRTPQPSPEISIHPIPKKKLSLSSIKDFAMSPS